MEELVQYRVTISLSLEQELMVVYMGHSIPKEESVRHCLCGWNGMHAMSGIAMCRNQI
jgi:hypothetical protein